MRNKITDAILLDNSSRIVVAMNSPQTDEDSRVVQKLVREIIEVMTRPDVLATT